MAYSVAVFMIGLINKTTCLNVDFQRLTSNLIGIFLLFEQKVGRFLVHKIAGISAFSSEIKAHEYSFLENFPLGGQIFQK